MEKQLLTIMNEKGQYLTSFKSNGHQILAYSAGWSNEFEHALKVDWNNIKNDDENNQSLKLWAETVGGKLVVIDIEYKVSELATGLERSECHVHEFEVRDAFELLFGDRDD